MIRPILVALSIGAFAPRLAAEVTPGEILIAEMNCVACHAASPEIAARLASRAAPHLGKNGVRVTPQWLREFLADPQKTAPGTLMPDMLHGIPDENKAGAVEDLTHFLVSIQPPAGKTVRGASAPLIEAGRKLYHDVGCVQCHAPEVPPASRANDDAAKLDIADIRKNSVPLGNLAMKFMHSDLAGFLRDPLRSHPSGRMPSQQLTPEEADAIAMYLLRAQMPAGSAKPIAGLQYEYYEQQFPELPHFERLKPTAAGTVDTFSLAPAKRKADFALRFHGIITVPKDGDYQFFTASDDGSRLSIDGRQIVENGGIHPEQERDGTAKLTAGMHAIEVVYFDGGGQSSLAVSWKGPGFEKETIPARVLSHEGLPLVPLGDAAFTLDGERAARGEILFGTLRCAECHRDAAERSTVEVMQKPARAFGLLRPRQPAGCLAGKPKPDVPKFDLTDRQRIVILAALQNQAFLAAPLTAEQQVKRTMTALNCYACHARDKRGGAEGLRRDYFATTSEVDLGDEGRIPPALTAIGAKLQTTWLREVLLTGGSVRPYMATRMPVFGETNVKHLPALFEEADARSDAQPQPDVFAPGAAADANKVGRKLIGTGGLGCIACHNFAGNKSLGVPALDLATSGQRLKWDWFRRYLLDPQSLRAGTRMPSFWPNGAAVNQEAFGGDSEKQIGAIWAYFARKNFTDLPPGLVQGKMEIVAEQEAVIYRNFIEGAGARAIGVAYPEKANLAFDANELRLALIWQGAFIDAARHRTGRGVGFEKPLGANVVHGPPGPPFAILGNDTAPWPAETGTAAGYQFRGYRLDEKQRPAFRFTYAGLDIEDYPVAVRGDTDAALHRVLTVRGTPGGTLYFRAAVGTIRQSGTTFTVGENLQLTFPGAKPFVRGNGDKAELLVPVAFTKGEAKLVEEIVW